MSEIMTLALQITAVGMGLVFAAIILLALVMEGLVRLTAEKAEPEAPVEAAEQPAAPAAADASLRRQKAARAAAVAVSVALAQQASANEPHEFPLPPTALVSAWQAIMRTRMLSKRGPTR